MTPTYTLVEMQECLIGHGRILGDKGQMRIVGGRCTLALLATLANIRPKVRHSALRFIVFQENEPVSGGRVLNVEHSMLRCASPNQVLNVTHVQPSFAFAVTRHKMHAARMTGRMRARPEQKNRDDEHPCQFPDTTTA